MATICSRTPRCTTRKTSFSKCARTGSDWKSRYLDGHAAYMLYFTSTDGVHWNRPDLGLVEIAGRRDHNIVFTSDMVTGSDIPGPSETKGFVVPTQAIRPQGKKAFFWSVNKHPRPKNPAEKFVALAIVQDHRAGAHRHVARWHSLDLRTPSLLANAE